MQIKDIKKLKRFNDIVVTLAKYGFDEVVDRFEIPGGDLLRKISPVEGDLNLFERIRSVLEELGPTFVKFGQVMSLRPDLLPQELLKELEKLQDSVPPVDSEKIGKALEQSLGGPFSDFFSEFHFEPVAAASLSQVHKARLRTTGEQVAVKVQRPGIQSSIKSDLDILDSIGVFLDQQFTELQCYELPELVKTVRRTLIKELDFNLERNNMNVARSYADQTEIHIPETFEELSSEKLLVMTYFDGIRFKDIVSNSKIDREKIAKQGLHAAVKQILEDGFFHADPHPGNLLVSEDMNLCFIDWGMVGRLTEHDRFILLELLSAVVDKDSRTLAQSFLRLCKKQEKQLDQQLLQRELLDLLDRYHAVPIKQMNIGHFLMSLLRLLRDFKLQLPADLVIMIKALVTADGSARLADPELNVIEEVSEHVHAISRQRYKPDIMWRNIKHSLAQFWRAQGELPRQLQHIVKAIEQGEFSVNFRLEKLERLVTTLENASNQLTIGIITGAIIMGSSMIITTGVKPFIFGLPALGVVGYLISVVLGLWLIVTILRNNKP